MECDDRTPKDSKRSLPPVLPTMTGLMEQVCVCARVLLWRWLGKRCHMSYHYRATPHFRELFDCSTYTGVCAINILVAWQCSVVLPSQNSHLGLHLGSIYCSLFLCILFKILLGGWGGAGRL
jgi:hypothetical protein